LNALGLRRSQGRVEPIAGANNFAYGAVRSRWRQIAATAGVTETTIYVAGIVEKVVKRSITLWKHYVNHPGKSGGSIA
jgi:alkylated DNA nucleotide flippase Atl1